MKKLVLVAAVTLSIFSFAQKKKRKNNLPPPPRIEKQREIIVYNPENTGITKDAEGKKLSVAGKILLNREDATFAWKKKGMTMIKKDSIYEKKFTLRSSKDVMLSESFSNSDIQLPMKDGYVYALNETMYLCTPKMNGDLISVYDNKKKLMGTFQIILNKSKNKIIHLKNTKTGDLFLPSKATPAAPMMMGG